MPTTASGRVVLRVCASVPARMNDCVRARVLVYLPLGTLVHVCLGCQRSKFGKHLAQKIFWRKWECKHSGSGA